MGEVIEVPNKEGGWDKFHQVDRLVGLLRVAAGQA
jgi:hypothetical protein